MLKYEFLGYDSSTNDERPGGTGAQGHPSRSRPQLPVINPILMMLDSDIFLVVNRLDMLWSDLYSQLDAYFDGTFCPYSVCPTTFMWSISFNILSIR